MTSKQMVEAFTIQVNQFDMPNVGQTIDTIYWLNKSQEQFIKNQYTGFNKYQRAFEQSQKIIENLKTIFIKDHVIDTTFNTELSPVLADIHVDYAKLPEDHFLLISNRTKVHYNDDGINYTVTDGSRVANEPFTEMIVSNRMAQSQKIYSLLSDPFNTTRYDSPIVDINEKGVDIYTDKKFIAKSCIINYLRYPKKINYKNQDCELPQHTHEEIVDGAVQLFFNYNMNNTEEETTEN